jgi:hypothetical protein
LQKRVLNKIQIIKQTEVSWNNFIQICTVPVLIYGIWSDNQHHTMISFVAWNTQCAKLPAVLPTVSDGFKKSESQKYCRKKTLINCAYIQALWLNKVCLKWWLPVIFTFNYVSDGTLLAVSNIGAGFQRN